MPLRRERMRRRHGREPGAERVGLGEPLGERFGAVEGEDAAGAGMRIARSRKNVSTPVDS